MTMFRLLPETNIVGLGRGSVTVEYIIVCFF